MDELRASWDLFWRIEDLDSSPCEVLMEINCCGVLDGAKDNIYIRIPHHLPLLHHQLLEISDGLAQCIFLSSWMSVERWSNMLLILSTYCCFFWVLCPSFRPLFFFLFKQINHWGAHPSQPFLTDVLDTDLRRGATLLAPPKQGSEWCFWWEQQLI